MNSKKIGIFIKRLREERNISQQELANLISIDRSNISRWENGNSVPTLETMGSICKLFNIELAELINQMRIVSSNSFGNSISGTYQHAKKDITLAKSRSYTISASGLGGVLKHNYASYYDAMQGISM